MHEDENSAFLEMGHEPGANPSVKDRLGRTPLHYAAKNGYFEVAETLSRAGASPSSLGLTKQTLLGLALENEQGEIVDYFLNLPSENGLFHPSLLPRPSGPYAPIWIDALCINHEDIVPYQSIEPEKFASFDCLPISAWEWNSLAALYLVQWSKSIWILQETVLANHIVITCGQHEIPWYQLEGVTEVLVKMNEQLGFAPSTSYIPITSVGSPIEDNESAV
ncbi:hypothetical protein K432DRAFT_391025 [Lepidopterella palustris CBS 459.81]|uniref:Heterokaryon incompatibility domain-containing protein n=1 Tax=Lepidopterella palustris CBS 459.81 TaxID=1314670 RepID=A0A8E2EF47_9PEZI|nr:hypothetical protein K432DRAFT_391025 [Lepidopterella palustris CBS 459.81]